jgi:hypothetical protein
MEACSIFLDIAAEFWEWDTAPETCIAPAEVAAAATEVLLRENRLKSQNFFRCSFSAIVFVTEEIEHVLEGMTLQESVLSQA